MARKLGISFGSFGYDADLHTQAVAIRNAGFDTCFVNAKRASTDLEQVCRELALAGLELESLHASFGGVSTVWEPDPAGEGWVKKLCAELELCRRYGAGYLTVHCMNVPQFNTVSEVKNRFSETGACRFAKIMEYADRVGVKVCFENVEFPGAELLSLINWLRERDMTRSLGITWDIGHWHCYPDSCDFVSSFGDLLTGTHIHDNFGNRQPGLITWDDDSHILPFDGTIDFRQVGQTLDRCGYRGSLTLELGRSHAIPWYADYPDIDAYLAEAYTRVSHIARFCQPVD